MDWLVPPNDRFPTPNRWAAGHRAIAPVEGLVYHYTAGAFRGAVAWLQDPRAGASAHFVVSKGGRVVQLAPLADRTWHAGVSKFRGLGNVNGRTVGIELENLGAPDPYPEPQLVALERLTAELVRLFPILAREPHIRLVGHSDVAPGRKIDPGPLFPWARIRAVAAACST